MFAPASLKMSDYQWCLSRELQSFGSLSRHRCRNLQGRIGSSEWPRAVNTEETRIKAFMEEKKRGKWMGNLEQEHLQLRIHS